MPTETKIKMCTPKEKEKEWGLSSKTIAQYCRDGLVIGAKQEENKRWYIPEDAQKPVLTATKAAMVLHHFETEERRLKLKEELERHGNGYDTIEEYLLELECIEQEQGKIKITKKSERLISKVSKNSKNSWDKFVSFAKLIPILLEIAFIILK